MDWRIKAFSQKVLSMSRIGDKLNHLNASMNKNYHENTFNYHFHECFRKYKYCEFNWNGRLKALEIGTGYSLVQPILLSLLGFNEIVTVDIDFDISLKSIQKQFKHINNLKYKSILNSKSIYTSNEIEKKITLILTSKSLQELLNELNIVYVAPYKISDIDDVCKSFDYIFSQVVFEHIKPSVLGQLFKYFKTSLKPNGYCVHTINFVDHFTNNGFFMDKNISEFNYLKYSDKYWNFWTGNKIAYINRLSHQYYLNKCKENDFVNVKFIGENYKEKINFDLDLVHQNILEKYNSPPNKESLIKYQRGTIIFQNQIKN